MSSRQSDYRTTFCISIALFNTTLSYKGWKYRSSLIGTEIAPPPGQNIVVKMSEGGVPYQYTLHSVWDWPRIAINKYQPHATPYSCMRVGEAGGGGRGSSRPPRHSGTNNAAASHAILLSYWLLAINSKLYIICATSIARSGGGVKWLYTAILWTKLITAHVIACTFLKYLKLGGKI